ncbi:MAG: hypothetical protein K2M93_00445 [Muribaculaceae bacterium]|nr:hypothetical protein [Muribaculaceae bacterium]
MNKIRSLGYVSVLSVVALVSCTDTELAYNGPEYLYASRALQEVENPGGLIQQTDGTWKSVNCRVPIVGPGRIVNEINTSTVNVIGVGQGSLDNVIDADLTNTCVIPVGISAGVAYTPIISVKDLYHVYAAGQKVGFVYKDTDNGGAQLLSLDLIKGMTLETYLKGKKQQSVYAADETSTLKLDLIAFNTGGSVADRVLSFDAEKPFDEVRMSFTGVSATVASNIALAIKYAFVGENPEIRATSEPQFSYYWTGGSPAIQTKLSNTGWTMTSVAGADALVDADTENSAPFTVVLGAPSMATVNFNRTIPVGTEIGYCFSGVNVIGLGLFAQTAPTLISYDDNRAEVERSTPSQSALGLSVVGVTGKNLTNMVTTKECSQLKFQHPSELLKVGGMSVYYAYVREGVKLDPVNYFTFGDDITYNFAYRLPQPAEGSVQYFILSQPYGTEPSIENGKLIGMTKDGAYRVQALYTAPDGRQVSQVATITHLSVDTPSGCNTYITASSHGAHATNALGTDVCVLCLFNGNNDLNNVVDNNPNNYATSGSVASVLEWSPVAAFQMTKPVESRGEKTRVGFIIQSNSYLLDLSALSLFTIKLYNGETLISENTTDDKTSIKLGLIGYDQSKMRLSVETDKTFDRIELWRKGVADVATSIRIYNIFQEPVGCEQSFIGGGCMEIMTNVKDNLVIDYPNTILGAGVLTVGTSFTDLDYIIDGDHETGALLGNIASVGGTTVALKFNKQKGNQSIGMIFSGLKGLADVNLADVGVLKVYCGDKEVASSVDVDVLGVDALGMGDYTFIEVMPEEDFDRITFTTAGVSLLSTTKICGVYYRPDSDGDGIPDCADNDDDDPKSLEPQGDDFHTCYGNPLTIPVTTNGEITDVYVYAYDSRINDNVKCKGKVSGGLLTIPAKALPVGKYLLFIYSEDEYLCSDITAIIHPVKTTWKTNAQSIDWNEWDNWSDGSPWSCTDVIIPSNANIYPELQADEKNYCKNIHFEPGAEVVGLSHLNIGQKAFVDLALQGGSYYLLSAPLKEMVTGDMFISPNVSWSSDKYFEFLTASNYKESRNRPIVYQYFWNGTAIENDKDLNGEDVGTAQWSKDFNSVSTRYELGQGFLLRAGATSDRNGYTFRFPKNHTSYSYYSSDGTFTGVTENIVRNTSLTGSLALTGNATVQLKNKAASNVFLMGNPYMTHINVSELVKANSAIKEIRVSKTRTYNLNRPIEEQTVSSTDDNTLLVAPMEAFFVIANNEATTLDVTLTEGMLTQKRSKTK